MPATKRLISDILERDVPQGRTRPRDNHFRTDDDEYEYIARLAHGSKIAALIRKFFFAPGWRDNLDTLRKKHRSAGIPDGDFYHPARLKELGRKPRGK